MNAGLEEASFGDADCRQTRFESASLKGASFRGANMRGADLTGADLRGVTFWGAKLEKTNGKGLGFRKLLVKLDRITGGMFGGRR